jgi:xylulokinase
VSRLGGPAGRGRVEVEGEVALGIDIGTTSVKAVAADAAGRVVARARVPHGLVVRSPTQVEHDAAKAWRRGPRRALAEVLARLDAQGGPRPVALCVAAMVPSLTAVDARGVPRTPGLLYGDERARDPERVPGSIVTGELEAMLRWTAGVAPDAEGYWPAQAVANRSLGGPAVVDASTAQSGFPLFNGQAWDEARLAAIGVGVERLPLVLGSGAPAGTVDGLVVASGAVDAMAEQMVAGADTGDAFVICGTTLIVWAVIDEWRQVPGLWTLPHTTPGRALVGGPSEAGGMFLDWAGRLVGRGAEQVHPERVPVWAPYPRGERTPLHDPDRRAGLFDLDLTHGPGALRRAAFEATGFVVRRHLELAGVRPRRLVATGGGTNVDAWMHALADCTGLPVDVAAVPEGAALGAAFLARMAAGLEGSAADASRWARTGRRVEPDPAWQDAADRRYRRFVRVAGAQARDVV